MGAGLVLAGRYRLSEVIGRGGMGKVWRAHDEVLHRTVAVKELTAGKYVSEADRAVLHARTQKEARAAARITHPGVVTVHDVLEHDDRPWIVMQYVDGPSLADAAKAAENRRIDACEAARIGLHVLSALRAAHAAGVLHRDVKPGNVLLAHDGRVLLTDFGIAAIEGDSTITRTGELVGSIDYLAPERVRGGDPGPASDLWSLGATLYTAVQGTSPFHRTSPISVMQAVVTEEPPPAEHAGALGPVIIALLRKDPADRPDATEAERMLLEAMEGRAPAAAQAYVPTRSISREELAAVTVRLPESEQDAAAGATPSTASSASRTAASAPSAGDPASSASSGAGTAGAAGHPAASGAAGPARTAGHPRPGSDGAPGPGAAAGPGAAGPAGPRGHWGADNPPHPRRGWRTALLVTVLAAVVGSAAGFAVMRYGNDDTARAAAGLDGPVRTVPDGWERVEDPSGFSLLVPQGWKRRTEGGQIDYTPDNGRHLIRISVDASPDFENPCLHMLDIEKGLKKRLPRYERKELHANTFRDQLESCLWEFTWVEKNAHAGERRAIDQVYYADDGTEYALYMSAPAVDWPVTREQFDIMLRGWRPAEE
ncbi:serine/threonine-protein kinase [Streptomyces sp. WAC05374]|uniref:serine/threonine-protein kinase n=1 Tax=Streptomyces sp. WAC05374 TaxID=2487420 RepID=UPI001F48452C|nr:serine/threonine-protein kinase [Streptomyces sp. WAC05374]